MTPAEIRSRIAAVRTQKNSAYATAHVIRLLEILDSGAVFIAVPDGEEVRPGYTTATNCIYDNRICTITSKCGGFVWLRPIESNDGGDFDIRTTDSVQPVKLINLKEET